MAQWKQYSGTWPLQTQMQAVAAGTWPAGLANTLYMTGTNGVGQLGQNNLIYRSSPVQVGSESLWQNVSASNSATFAIKSDGTLWAWGGNTYGLLGRNNQIAMSSPVQVGALTSWQLVSGGYYSCAAIRTDGTLWTWGYNNAGQLGHGDAVNKSSPVQVGSGSWSYVSVGIFAMMGVTTAGQLYSWGNGQGAGGASILGLGDIQPRSSPTQVGAGTTWLKAIIGQYSSMATKTDGTIWGWGYNVAGQIGDNTTINRSSPVQVGALTSWTLAKTNGYAHSIGRRNNGTLWLWGRGTYGELGQNSAISYSSPVQLGSGTDWSSEFIPLYASANVAIKTDGTLWVWGQNPSGRFGTNNTTNYSSPVQVGSDTNWRKVPESGNIAYFVPYLKSP